MEAEATNIPWKGTSIVEMSEGFDTFDLKQIMDIKNSRDHTVLFHLPLPTDSNNFPVPQQGSDIWDGNHVRLPCSKENTYRELDNEGKNQNRLRWDLIQQSLLRTITNSYELENAIKEYNTKYRTTWNFVALHELMENEFLEEESKNFFEEVLPNMVILALRLPHLIKSRIPLLKQGRNRSISLSQEQVACLLANAFFCTFPRRNSTKNNSEYSNYPDINFNRLFSSSGENVVQKLKCICTYFRQVCNIKMPKGVITFQRRYVDQNNLPKWSHCDIKFSTIKLHVSSKGRIEKDGTGMLQVDFANKFLGGGVLGHGCVQEEIRFVICPELIVGRLFVESLKPEEAVLMVGCEQYCSYKGYAQTFEWTGPHNDTLPHDEFRRKFCSIVAIDALQFQGNTEQYKEQLMRRELNKAYVGFLNDLPTIAPCVASGNWGCGAFGGISTLKALLQLMACVVCKRNLSYFTFGDDHLRDKLFEVYKFLTEKKITVSQLWENLREYYYYGNADEPDLLFPFIYQQYENMNNQKFSKTNDNSDQIAVTSAVSKNNTSIDIEFPEKKLWEQSSINKFPIFTALNKKKQQSENKEVNRIQLKEKRKFEMMDETFAEKSNPISATKYRAPSMVECLGENYELISSASKKHRFDDQADSNPISVTKYRAPSMVECLDENYELISSANEKLHFDDQPFSNYLSQYVANMKKNDAANSLHHLYGNNRVDSPNYHRPQQNGVDNVIDYEEFDVLERVYEHNSESYMIEFNKKEHGKD